MAINFGELDYYDKVPADELKDKLRGIAYEGIRELLADIPTGQGERFLDRVDGIVTVTEMFCEQVDEEVAHKNAEMDQMLQKWNAEGSGNDASA